MRRRLLFLLFLPKLLLLPVVIYLQVRPGLLADLFYLDGEDGASDYAAVRRALSSQPSQRQSSVNEFLTELKAIL